MPSLDYISAGRKSRQDVRTPPDLLAFVEKYFGKIDIDLAATKENAVCETFISPREDSLLTPWREYKARLGWLNPPFGNVSPWLMKCIEETSVEFGVVTLLPCSLDTNWFWKYIYRKRCSVYPLRGRLSFPGYHNKAGKPQSAGQGHMLVYYQGVRWCGIDPLDWRLLNGRL